MPRPDRRTALLVLGLILAIALTFIFGYRTGREVRSIRRQNEPIRQWMSIPFIAHVHHTTPDILYHAIGLEPQLKDHRPLRRIARDQKRSVDELIRELNAAIARNGAPGAPPPTTPEPKKP